jgi:hypothetical protein
MIIGATASPVGGDIQLCHDLHQPPSFFQAVMFDCSIVACTLSIFISSRRSF